MRLQSGPAPDSDVILDILIVVVFAVAVFIGYKRGTVQPVFGLLGFGIVLLLLLSRWAAYSSYLDRRLHSNGVIDALAMVIVALVVAWAAWKLGEFVRKLPIVRGVDGLLGVLVCGLIAIWLLYGLISLATAMGKAFDGTIGQTTTTEAQAQAITTWVGGNPVLRVLVSKDDLRGLEQAAKTPNNPASELSNFTSLEQLQAIYRDVCQPQLESSHLAPVVMWIGKRTPVIGHQGPSDLPSRPTPSPSPSPAPAGSPAPR